MNSKISLIVPTGFALMTVILTACVSPATASTPTPLVVASPTFITTALPAPLTPFPTIAGLTPGATLPVIPLPGSSNICTAPQVPALIDSLKTSMLNSDGPLLASVVSQSSGMDVSYFHNGTVVNYQPDQARFLFETTYEVDWGVEPGSGAPKQGSFHDVVVPAMVKFFNQLYTLHCNEIKHGGASYPVTFP